MTDVSADAAIRADSLTYVRQAMLAPEPPPVGERGAVKWVRENLISTPLNAILTLLALYVIWRIAAGLIPWLLNGVWDATSLQECRDKVIAKAGEGASGACWAMLRERWHQFIFGLYPSSAYWRPVMAFGLLFAALAPVLFSGLPRRLLEMLGISAAFLLVCLPLAGAPGTAYALIAALFVALALAALRAPRLMFLFTAIYPALVLYLLWGGSIWAPVTVLLGFAVLALVARLTQPMVGVIVSAILGVVAAVLWWAYAYGPVSTALGAAIPIRLPFIPSSEFGGFLLAILIGVTAIAASLPLGILLALGRQSDMVLLKTLCVGFIEFIRGVPLITLLFTASLLLGYFLPPGTTFDIILRVMILVSFFAAAYLAEVIRGGLAALPRGQYEAADALGLDYWRGQRLIILPQALKIAIPGIVSTFIGLFKDTTLVSFVALLDPLRGVTNLVRADIAWKGIYWEPYIFVGAIFFVICFGMSRYSMYLEQKLKRDHR